MRISVLVLVSLGASAASAGAQILEPVAPLRASATFFAARDNVFDAVLASSSRALLSVDLFRAAAVEHLPGPTGESLTGALVTPPAAASFDSPRGSERAPTGEVSTGFDSAVRESPRTQPVSEPSPDAPAPETATPVTPVPDPLSPDPVTSTTSTPEPATIALTASGLAALAGYARRRRQTSRAS